MVNKERALAFCCSWILSLQLDYFHKQAPLLPFTSIVRFPIDFNQLWKWHTHTQNHSQQPTQKPLVPAAIGLTCVSVSVLSAWYFNKSFNETDVCTISANIGIKGSIIICRMNVWTIGKIKSNRNKMVSISVTHVKYLTQDKWEIQLNCTKKHEMVR